MNFPTVSELEQKMAAEQLVIQELEASLVEASQELQRFDAEVMDAPEIKSAMMTHLTGYNRDQPFQLPEAVRTQRRLIVEATRQVQGLLERSRGRVTEWENTIPVVAQGYELIEKLSKLLPAYEKSYAAVIKAWQPIQELAQEHGASVFPPPMMRGIALELTTHALGSPSGRLSAEIRTVPQQSENWVTGQNLK